MLITFRMKRSRSRFRSLVKRLKNKEVASVKVLRRNHPVESANWEVEAAMMSHYTHIFPSTPIPSWGNNFLLNLVILESCVLCVDFHDFPYMLHVLAKFMFYNICWFFIILMFLMLKSLVVWKLHFDSWGEYVVEVWRDHVVSLNCCEEHKWCWRSYFLSYLCVLVSACILSW